MPDETKPNIVIVLADDMGWGDVGAFNPESKIPTPNMDRVAAEGRSFTDAHAASAVCTPSRYSILTGRYCWRSALPRSVLGGYEPPLIEPERETLASMLSANGYRTAAIGKWHLGLGFSAKRGENIDFDRPLPWGSPDREFEEKIDFEAPITGGPIELGFDYFFGAAGCPTCNPPYGWIENDRFIEPPSVYEEDYFYTGRPGMKSASWDHKDADPTILAKSLEFIDETAGTPFLLYVGLDSPHEPCVEEVVPEIARGKSNAGPRGDLVWYVDHVVGEIDGALHRKGVAEDTIFIVTSDNGALAGDRILDEDGNEIYRDYGHLSNGPWRGQKSHIWEGGHREPLIIRWPGRIPASDVRGGLVCLGDLMASIAALLGIELDESAAEDSFDLSQLLFGIAAGPGRDTLITHSHRGVFSVRKGRWKAIFGSKGSGGWPPPAGDPPTDDDTIGQLYDLVDDPRETRDLWDERQDVVAELRAILDQARTTSRTAPL